MKLRDQVIFYQQRGQQLETIIFSLCNQLKAAGIPLKLPFFDIEGDQYLNDVNTGEFAMRLLRQTGNIEC